MDPALISDLPALLSPDRFAPYLAVCTGDAAKAVRLYTWNIEVSAAFWGPIHALEVALRNALHDRMTLRYERHDWWAHPSVQFNAPMKSQRDQALADASRAAQRGNRQAVAGDIVAVLSFGFWVGLLGSGGPLQYETRYWQPALRRTFPIYGGSRVALHRDLDYLRVFRNRLAHHEPIFKRHLAADHANVLKVATYIGSAARIYIESHSRVPAVLAKRTAVIATGQDTHF